MPLKRLHPLQGQDSAGKPPKRRIHHRVAEQLGIAIVSGEYSENANLPNEIEASENLGVSRAAYREAIRILTAKGLVQSRPRAGTTINPRDQWSILDPDVLNWMFKGRPSPAFIDDLFELRSIIEPAATALAAQRRDASQLSRMGYALEVMSSKGLDSAEGLKADLDFHAEILRASGNEAIAALVGTIATSMLHVVYKNKGKTSPRDTLPDHRAVFEAIVASDAERAWRASTDLLGLASNHRQGLAKK